MIPFTGSRGWKRPLWIFFTPTKRYKLCTTTPKYLNMYSDTIVCIFEIQNTVLKWQRIEMKYKLDSFLTWLVCFNPESLLKCWRQLKRQVHTERYIYYAQNVAILLNIFQHVSCFINNIWTIWHFNNPIHGFLSRKLLFFATHMCMGYKVSCFCIFFVYWNF